MEIIFSSYVLLDKVQYTGTCIYVYMYREKVLKWNGWGYKDSGFRFNEKNVAEFIGKR